MKRELWDKLQGFEFDDPQAGFSFSDRLARENGWSEAYAAHVIEEYRRFLYLCCEAGHPVTPSDEVDQAWHLHLCYTRSYWDDLCQDTLGRKIHHGPTKGGATEREKFREWYSKTLESYRREFGEVPPVSIWPNSEQRFRAVRYERVNRSQSWVLSKAAVVMALTVLVAGFLLVSCTGEEVGLSAVFVGGFFVIVFAIIIGVRKGGGGGGNGCAGGTGGCGNDSGGCGGGCGGCGGS